MHVPGLLAAGCPIRGLAVGGCTVPGSQVTLAVRPTRLLRGKARLLIDLDDLLFADPSDFPLVRAGLMGKAEAASRGACVVAALSGADGFTVSTEPLAVALRQLAGNRPVTVVHNGVDPQWRRIGQAMAVPWRPGAQRVLRWLVGTRGHIPDLAVAATALSEALRRWDDLVVELVGPLSGATISGAPPNRIRYRPAVPWKSLPRLVAGSWAVIAPLADTNFNRAKSAIKFLESAAFGVPCIGTPIPDMVRCAPGGVLLANHRDEWLGHFERLRDDDERARIGLHGASWIDQYGLAPRHTPLLAEALRACIR